ncbi:MAG: MarR family transcriptional regulator [Chloroflexi bacterium]|nr:MarR family transcriptional regulator [Chloroflexota bacterium]
MDEQERRALIEQIVGDRSAIFRTMRADWTKELITGELTLPQVRVLFLLEQAGGLSMSSLAEALGKAQPTATGLVDRLVEAGLVERAEHAADRRVIIARLTTTGHDLIAGLAEAGSAHTRRLIGQLPPDDLRTVAHAYAIMRREARA